MSSTEVLCNKWVQLRLLCLWEIENIPLTNLGSTPEISSILYIGKELRHYLKCNSYVRFLRDAGKEWPSYEILGYKVQWAARLCDNNYLAFSYTV